jgi:cellulose synthase/poly-beta-1,6-N-acetylglucosamine synthase-like glycosyltransferase
MYWLPAILILPYIFILLKIYWSLLKIRTFYCITSPQTFVSVVVACRNEERSLPSLLNSIALQDYPHDLFEVLIVNDNSSDKTAEIAASFNRCCNIRSLDNNTEGKKQALRTGILAARGNLIITTDADCTAGRNWIRTIAGYYDMNKPDLIICPVRIKADRGFFGKFIELEFLSLQGITAGTAVSDKGTMCNGANLAFTREAYLAHSDNLHDEINSGDDIFLLHSLKRDRDSKISWLESPDAMITTESPLTIRSFLKQRSRWLSKGKDYKDCYTIILGICTFLAILLQTGYLLSLIIWPSLIWTLLSVFVLKSIPDLLILHNTTERYSKRKLMWWFLPSQLIYPFYVLAVLIFPLISREKRMRLFE